MSSESENSGSDGDSKVAKIMATVIASLVGTAIMAGGGAVVSNSLSLASLLERVDAIRGDIEQLNRVIVEYPPARDLQSLRERVNSVERATDVVESNIERLERGLDREAGIR